MLVECTCSSNILDAWVVNHARLEKGTTYNSFLIFGEKTALVDASHEKFRDLYMSTLKEQLKAAGRSLDYVLVSHTEPDHSGELSYQTVNSSVTALLIDAQRQFWSMLLTCAHIRAAPSCMKNHRIKSLE